MNESIAQAGSDDTPQQAPMCCKCGRPIARSESGVRHYGFGNAHSEHRCLQILQAEIERLGTLINTPQLDNFLRAVHIEAVHQVERWGEAHDRAKSQADWYWLIGYLAGKALYAALAGDRDKARHHTISSAAALYNWHCALQGSDVRTLPGRSDVEKIIESAFPGEAAKR